MPFGWKRNTGNLPLRGALFIYTDGHVMTNISGLCTDTSAPSVDTVISRGFCVSSCILPHTATVPAWQRVGASRQLSEPRILYQRFLAIRCSAQEPTCGGV